MSDASDSCPDGTESEPPQPRPAGLISVDVIENGGDWTAIPDVIAAICDAAEAAARFPQSGLSGVEAAVELSDDAAVAALNASYRGNPSPTNVLSFPARQATCASAEQDFVGDIILAAETVMREADELAIPPRHHLQHLVVHALLHLAGFDHDSDSAAARMETLEAHILATLAIPNPYVEAELEGGA